MENRLLEAEDRTMEQGWKEPPDTRPGTGGGQGIPWTGECWT